MRLTNRAAIKDILVPILEGNQAKAPAVHISKVEMHRVTCPYCAAGFAMVEVHRRSNAAHIEGKDDPRKCQLCGAYFMLHVTLKIDSKRMEARNGRRA